MCAKKLSGLQPASVFSYFEEICAIPHGSRNTKAISDYLVSFAKEKGICCEQDELNNVLMYVPGTCGMESHSPVILQGHIDMVCEKDADCPINMDTEGLDVDHDDAWIFAHGTTLGGDNGIAVAYMLAIAADPTIPHPPLELIFTVDEEIGMEGAAGVDLSRFKSRTMVNLDSESEGIFTVSCAGGIRSMISMPVERRVVYGPCVKLTVDGLRGGHSGVEIHKPLANANKVMGDFLGRVQQIMPLCITKLTGGAKDNAIPRSCEVTMIPLGINVERINGIANQLQEEIRAQFDEPFAVVRGDNVDALGGNALTTECTAKVIALLNAAPNGVQSMSEDIEGLVQTSLNLGVVSLEEAELNLTFALRSSVNQEKADLRNRLYALAAFYGAQVSEMGDYPAWEYKKDSVLRETMVAAYRRLYGKDAEVIAIHAGLECGLLSEKLPGLDCVSIGPDMQDIHTSRERLSIASTKRTWEFLLEVLKAL
ncbi:MAG: aminoacyl-histidine dipeptidase [Ruminococcaceae bacterium]|nr:aminoacyl-histidine dipeptidase [Oscillospiraceae bacterium]